MPFVLAFFFSLFSLWAVLVCAGVWCFFVLFFWFFMVSSVPVLLVSSLASASCVGVCGSRSVVPPASVWSAFVGAVPVGVPVSCGCVGGVCGLARSSFVGVSVFRASSFGSGSWAFARRSVALVRSVASCSSAVWVSFPGRVCPAGLLPSAVASRCFCGLGSGSWASLALAVGLGVRCFVWLPSGVPVPAGWSLVALGGGWFFCASPSAAD